jgi:hypothetical protein
MRSKYHVPVNICALLVLLFALGTTFGSGFSVQASFGFSVLNSSVGINQGLFFNLSVNFPQNVNYTIYLNNTVVKIGTISADSPSTQTIEFNITNFPAGRYAPSVKFSALSSKLLANSTVTVTPKPAFSFLGYSDYTPLFNGSARLLMRVIDSGNTPLNLSWSLPTVTGVAFNLLFKQTFSLLPNQVFYAPINISVSKVFDKNLNFSFLASYGNYSFRHSYLTSLFAPVINLSFFNTKLNPVNNNLSTFSANITNGDNLPINVTFQFLVDINGNDFYYNKSYVIYPNTSSIAFSIPAGTILSTKALYTGQNGSETTQEIFSQQAPSGVSQSDLITSIGYVTILGIAIMALLYLHHKLTKRK